MNCDIMDGFCFFKTTIENLNIQLDAFESELETMAIGSKKKKLDKDVSIIDTNHYPLENRTVAWVQFICSCTTLTFSCMKKKNC